MKRRNKITLMSLLLLAVLVFATGCQQEQTPYEKNDSEDYDVSVKYDANGGTFTTNTSVIVDSYNVTEMKTDGAGKVQLALLSPDDSRRGNDAFAAVNNGYFLAGWYANRTQTGGTEEAPIYSYTDKWEFGTDTVAVDPNEAHTSEEPVLTLYAVWLPLFEVEFYAMDSGELLGTYQYSPLQESELKVPVMNEKTGTYDMYRFPQRKGYTYEGAYFDAEGTTAITGETVSHTAVIDYENGTVSEPVMKIYLSWTEGEWYHIHTAEQFVENASVNGNYIIYEDLDFSDEIWPSSLMYGNFNGTIQGNGHTFRNIVATQTNNSKVNAGLFGSLGDKAVIEDVTFQGITFTIQGGTRVTGASFGLFAGTISPGTTLSGVTITESTLQVDSKCYFGVEDYSIGLLCGVGDASVVDCSGITAVATGDHPERVVITVNGNAVTLEFVNE